MEKGGVELSIVSLQQIPKIARWAKSLNCASLLNVEEASASYLDGDLYKTGWKPAALTAFPISETADGLQA